MSEAVKTLVSDRMREARGRWSEFGTPSFPISASDIRRWAIAVYWPETPPREYWDEEYAASTEIEREWVNQNGESVRRTIDTVIRYERRQS